jgi:hypothetical protein
VVQNTTFDLGVDIASGATVSGAFGDVYLGSGGAGVRVVGSNRLPSTVYPTSAAVIWGPGVLNLVSPPTSFSYTCATATTTFLNGSGGNAFNVNGLGVGCSFTYVNGTATATIVCGPLTAPNLQSGGIFAGSGPQFGAWLPGYAITCFP